MSQQYNKWHQIWEFYFKRAVNKQKDNVSIQEEIELNKILH